MIQVMKNGAELSTKLAELRAIKKSEAYRTALYMRQANEMLDERLAEARRIEREGKQLIADGITMDGINEIVGELMVEEEAV